MIGTEIVRTMIDYNYATHARVWDSIMILTDEQFLDDVDYSHGSLRNHMVHLASVDARWLRGLREMPDARSFTYAPEDYTTRESVQALCDSVAADVKSYVAGLDDEALGKTPSGIPASVWQVLLHIVNHGTDHRAQMLHILYDNGAMTFDQDAINHFMRG